MSGFRRPRWRRTTAPGAEYITTVRDAGIRVVETQIVMIERGDRPPVVYLVQPLLRTWAINSCTPPPMPTSRLPSASSWTGSGPCTRTLPRPRSTRNCRTGPSPSRMTRNCWMWEPLRPVRLGVPFDQEILLSAIRRAARLLPA